MKPNKYNITKSETFVFWFVLCSVIPSFILMFELVRGEDEFESGLKFLFLAVCYSIIINKLIDKLSNQIKNKIN